MTICAGLLVAVAGCGGSGRVSGKVRINEQPVAAAEVVFEMQYGEESGAFYGITSANGEYVIDDRGQGGIPTGQYRVTVTRHTLKNGQPIPADMDDEAVAILKENGQTKVSTETFSKEVVSGKNSIDLPLSDTAKLSN